MTKGGRRRRAAGRPPPAHGARPGGRKPPEHGVHAARRRPLPADRGDGRAHGDAVQLAALVSLKNWTGGAGCDRGKQREISFLVLSPQASAGSSSSFLVLPYTDDREKLTPIHVVHTFVVVLRACRPVDDGARGTDGTIENLCYFVLISLGDA